VQVTLDLPDAEEREIQFSLGAGRDLAHAQNLIERYRTAGAAQSALEGAWQYWKQTLAAVHVETPDASVNLMANGWLLYQILSCRFWGRTGFYQSGGAYGFRDQLQDGMAIMGVLPAMARAHLLRAAARQFVEGDVQHWWLPHSGQGVRSRISDDRAWLAFATAHYVRATDDTAILDEVVPFLEGPRLGAAEHENAFQPTISDETGTLYEHCARALDQSLALGAHGLPLIGGGDWNDGMNRVGAGGQGESVWLGWLVYATLVAFAPIAEARSDTARAASWRSHAAELQASLEREAWDGDWYRRGWFDDGTPFGSASSAECRIDSIAQAWSVFSGAAERGRTVRAMAAVKRELIRPEDGLALLFTPPFDQTGLDPGYIKGYPPGLRENGGQYTHAALWSVMAFAALEQGDEAAQLFSLLNPINHARTRAGVQRYKVEPYVVAADVYSNPRHVGRGGWTWYSGSAGWMQRAGIESILGLRLQGATLHLDPCIPNAWPRFAMTIRYRSASYEIEVENPEGAGRGIASADFDGAMIETRPMRVPLADDGITHRLLVRLG